MVDGDPDLIFGSIQSVTVDPRGTILVLDGQALDLRAFDPTGVLKGRIGRAGRGPGEFRQFGGLALDSDGTVYVADPLLSRITRFFLDSTGLVYAGDVVTDLRPRSICVLGGRTFITNATDDGIVHELDADGRPVRSFGDALRFVDDEHVWADSVNAVLLRQNQNDGRLLCDAAHGTVILAHQRIPFVRAFDLAGNELWRTELRPFHRERVTRGPRAGSLVYGNDPATRSAHDVKTVFFWDPVTIGVGLSERSPTNLVGAPELRLLSRIHGGQAARVLLESLPAARHADRLIGFTNTPFPHVTVHANTF